MTVQILRRGGNVVRAMFEEKPDSPRAARTAIDAELDRQGLERVGSIGKPDRGGLGYLLCVSRRS